MAPRVTLRPAAEVVAVGSSRPRVSMGAGEAPATTEARAAVATLGPSSAVVRRGTLVPVSAPELLQWNVTVYDTSGYALAAFQNNLTSLPVNLRFILVSGKTSYGTNQSSPAQVSPHIVYVQIINAAHRGRWYDLYWNYTYEGVPSGNILIAPSAIYVPAVGEGTRVFSG